MEIEQKILLNSKYLMETSRKTWVCYFYKFFVIENNIENYTSNNNGIFIDLNKIDRNVLEKFNSNLENFIKGYSRFKKYEIQRQSIEEDLAKNRLKNLKNDKIEIKYSEKMYSNIF